jgi:pimeloyl-ACP methyl ester carboxylesterase
MPVLPELDPAFNTMTWVVTGPPGPDVTALGHLWYTGVLLAGERVGGSLMARKMTMCRAAIAALAFAAVALTSAVPGAGGVAAGASPGSPGSPATPDTQATPGAASAPAQTNEDGTDPLPPLPDDVALPIVFVHGFAGSAQQYESQAIRFAANGYPQDRIVAYDHDGAGLDLPGYVNGLDDVIDETLARFDVDQVYLVGHSRGTFVSTQYLGDAARADKVAKYVALDGAPCPTAVPCQAVTQATNPGQAHVEVATSKESFAAQYEFLVGEAPEVVDIVPQRDPIELSGRAVNFPANTGREGATLDIWAIDSDTGARTGDEPHASFELGADGSFGPFTADHGAHYEWVLSEPGSEVQHHLYLQPYLRSSHLVRLLSSPPDGPTRQNTNVSDDHAAIITMRMREWYANDVTTIPGDQRDQLQISTRHAGGDEEPVNAVTQTMGNGTIGLHFHDDAATPGETTLAPLPYFSQQPFQNGADVLMPASGAAEPGGTITVTNIPRGQTDRPQTLNVPNWPSSLHAISVVFTDYPVDTDAPEAALVLDPAAQHTDGQQVGVTGSDIPDTYAGPPFWIFPATGGWVLTQCGAGIEDDPSIGGVFTHCAAREDAAVQVQGGALDADLVVGSTITGILGDEIDCATAGACVVALARVESGGEVTVMTAPLSFGAG